MEHEKPIFDELFSCGEYFINKTSELKYQIGCIRNQSITYVPFDFPEDIVIHNCFETTHDKTLIPGYAIGSNQGYYFLSFFNCEIPTFEKIVDKLYIPFFKSIVLDSFVFAYIGNYELLLNNNSMFRGIPDDSYFICNNTRRGLIISNSIPFALVTTKKKVFNFPSGFSLKMVCASFFDNETIVFATNNNMIHLYSFNADIKSIKLKTNILKVETANVNCYEPVCICITSDYELISVHFLSSSVTLLANNIWDFCIVHSPFDQIIIKDIEGNLSILKLNQIEQINSAIRSIISALDSRIVTGIEQTSYLRSRLTFRDKIIQGDTSIFPPMITLFGEEPNEENENNENKQQFWIENINGLNFEISSDSQIPSDLSFFLTSKSCLFVCSYKISTINEKRISVSCQIVVEQFKQLEPFHVFLKPINDQLIYIDSIFFSIEDLTKQKQITRIDESYFISFQNQFQTMYSSDKIENVDNGAIIHVTSNNCSNFEKEASLIKFSLPDDSKFIHNQDYSKILLTSKEMIQRVEKFIISIQFSETQSIDKNKLLTLQSSIDELFSSIKW